MHDISNLKPPVPIDSVDLRAGWEPVPGDADGVEQKLLSGTLDEDKKLGVRTRLIRFQPGAVVNSEFLHDYWEEVYLIEGHLNVAGENFYAPSYACRPPGTPHSPFASPKGCSFLEIQYYV